ncbi:hypothetical protein BDQ17DRAFT_1544360 [Cyathus striatus]|nr:hypothetical protein BDQ17DRAFT_1544360 [Cyathus striatus]
MEGGIKPRIGWIHPTASVRDLEGNIQLQFHYGFYKTFIVFIAASINAATLAPFAPLEIYATPPASRSPYLKAALS